jgi:hypothetical protein
MHRPDAWANVFAQNVKDRSHDSIGLPKEAYLILVLDEYTAVLFQVTVAP